MYTEAISTFAVGKCQKIQKINEVNIKGENLRILWKTWRNLLNFQERCGLWLY